MSAVFLLGMLATGCLVGLMNAALGIGGGILMVPALRELVPGIDAHTAKGTSLFIIIFVAASNAWRQNRGHDVPWHLAGVLACGTVLGGYSGAWFTGLLSGTAVTWIFVALLGIVVIRLMGSEPRPLLEASRHGRNGMAFGIGLVTGLASGMTGIGGGLVLVSLVLIAGLSTNERVTGLSNLVMVATCVASSIVHLRAERTLGMAGTVGQVNLAVAPAIVLGALAGSPAGQWVNVHLTHARRKIVLIVLIVVIAARMIYHAVHAS